MNPLLEAHDVDVYAPGGRPLFRGLNMRLARERIALVGRNGVGKSRLLAVLAGEAETDAGRVQRNGRAHFVPQRLAQSPARGSSDGEARRAALVEARTSGAPILLLDEPTEDLDESGVAWLRSWLKTWPGCAVTATHDQRLLADFEHFFLVSEAGCRYVHGSAAAVLEAMDRDHEASERRYAGDLRRLAEKEAHTHAIAQRKARKQRYGRCSEIDRATSRMRLNRKRSEAQVSHGRASKVRDARIDAAREWSKAARRALSVELPLEISMPVLPPRPRDVLVAEDISGLAGERTLFQDISLRMGRGRVGVVGANGAGKTTLLETLTGERAVQRGTVTRDAGRLGSIAQGGMNWMRDETLLERLAIEAPHGGMEQAARTLVAHAFPLALAQRPLRSLSPGERARAALLCLFGRAPPIELLIMDEPTYSLDLVGQRAMTEVLRAWTGGLIVASHDRAFLTAIGVETVIQL